MIAVARGAVALLLICGLAGCGEATSGASEPPQKVRLTGATASGLSVRVDDVHVDGQPDCGGIAAITSVGGPGGRQGQSNRICETATSGPAPAFVLVRAHGRRGAVLIVNDVRACGQVGAAPGRGRTVTSVCADVASSRQALLVVDRDGPVSLRGLAPLRRFSASRYPCSVAQGVCFSELDRFGRPRG